MPRAKIVYESPWLIAAEQFEEIWFTDPDNPGLTLCADELGELFDIKGASRIQIALYDNPVVECVKIEGHGRFYWGILVDGDSTLFDDETEEILYAILGENGNQPLYACCFIPES